MKKRQNTSARASALQITFLLALIFVSAILLALGTPGNPKQTVGQSPLGGPTLGDYPDTSLPLSTDTTVTPDAAPTNTMSINVSTSTDFNGTLAGDPATGVVRVTDAHPAGTYTVTVTAFESGGATATKTFTLTVTTPVTCLSISFAAAANFPAGTTPVSVAVGDFNGDGKQDLATANFGPPWDVSILLGDGTGNFSPASNYFGVGQFPNSVAVGDFNGDGKQDLAVGSINGVSILLGDGAGHFSANTNFGGLYLGAVAVGDFNGDGKQDLAAANAGSDNVSILLGDGTGNFGAPTNVAVGDSPHSVAVGDFNGDGKQDLAVANDTFSGTVSILLGDGTGNFSAATNFTAGTYPRSVAVGDFNGDGKQDLAVANDTFSGPVSILLGDGTGNFSAPTNFTAGSHPHSVAVGDFNGDGKQDLAAANDGSDNVSILLGDGTGNFGAPRNFAVGGSSYSVAVGDFNGDGKQDLAAANDGSDNVSILLRDCPVSQITPAGTSCSQFSSGTAETLGIAQYDLTNNLIDRVVPHGFLYLVPVTAPAGENIFRITQTITTGNFNSFFADIGYGSNVRDSDCIRLQRTVTQSGDTVTVRFNAPAAGTYFIAIKFNAQSLFGEPAPSPGTTVHYNFTTRACLIRPAGSISSNIRSRFINVVATPPGCLAGALRRRVGATVSVASRFARDTPAATEFNQRFSPCVRMVSTEA